MDSELHRDEARAGRDSLPDHTGSTAFEHGVRVRRSVEQKVGEHPETENTSRDKEEKDAGLALIEPLDCAVAMHVTVRWHFVHFCAAACT